MMGCIRINTLSRTKEGQSGFTLIEMMMVIAIVGILSVVAVPKYRAMTDYYHLQSSVQTVTSFVRYAKQRALDEHVPNYVGITKGASIPANTVQVFFLDQDVVPSVPSVVQLKSLDAGVALLSGTNTVDNYGMLYVSFDNRGYLAQSNTSSFTLKGSSNRTIVINIDYLGNVSTIWN